MVMETIQSSADFDRRQVLNRSIWERKKSIQLIYQDFHRHLFSHMPSTGRILDVGGGTAHVKSFRPDVVTMDILPFAGIDFVADAQDMPFSDASFSGIVMLDVLHHIERPLEFLREAARVLKAGGRLAMLEPSMTPVARWFYDHVHQEPVDLKADAFAPVVPDPNRDPYDANAALPHLLFAKHDARKRVEQIIPALRIQSVTWHSMLAYPLSGGFKRWTLIPEMLVKPVLRFEEMAPTWLRKLLAFRMMIILERVE